MDITAVCKEGEVITCYGHTLLGLEHHRLRMQGYRFCTGLLLVVEGQRVRTPPDGLVITTTISRLVLRLPRSPGVKIQQLSKRDSARTTVQVQMTHQTVIKLEDPGTRVQVGFLPGLNRFHRSLREVRTLESQTRLSCRGGAAGFKL